MCPRPNRRHRHADSIVSPVRIRSNQLLEGEEPDARFTLANERTFLAWNRTALALISVGLAVTQLLPPFRVTFGRRIIGLPLIVLGAVFLTVTLAWRPVDSMGSVACLFVKSEMLTF